MKETETLFEPEKPAIPDKWEIVPFQKVVSVHSDKGKRVKQRAYLSEGKLPVIDHGQDFIGGLYK